MAGALLDPNLVRVTCDAESTIRIVLQHELKVRTVREVATEAIDGLVGPWIDDPRSDRVHDVFGEWMAARTFLLGDTYPVLVCHEVRIMTNAAATHSLLRRMRELCLLELIDGTLVTVGTESFISGTEELVEPRGVRLVAN